MQAGGLLFIIHYYCMYWSTSNSDDPYQSYLNTSRQEYSILIHYNKQNYKIIERMHVGNGKQLIMIL